MKRTTILMACVALGLFGGTASAVTVAANANIYGAGFGSVPDGTPPTQINLGADQYLTFAITGGSNACASTWCVSFDGRNFNDPDGFGAVSDEAIGALNSISGISGFNAGFLTGVFESGVPGGSAPASLAFPDATSTSFATFSPLIDQTFFIGDGLTGDATGAAQKFIVPTGATTLYLGYADACGYHGLPNNCYDDNVGSLQVAVAEVSSAPEPATTALIGLGLAGLVLARRKPRR